MQQYDDLTDEFIGMDASAKRMVSSVDWIHSSSALLANYFLASPARVLRSRRDEIHFRMVSFWRSPLVLAIVGSARVLPILNAPLSQCLAATCGTTSVRTIEDGRMVDNASRQSRLGA